MKKTKAFKIIAWSLITFIVLFTLACIIAGAGFLLNVIIGIPFWIGILIYAVIATLAIVFLCSAEEDND